MSEPPIQTPFAYYVAFRTTGRTAERHWFRLDDLGTAFRLVFFMKERGRLLDFGIDTCPEGVRLWGRV